MLNDQPSERCPNSSCELGFQSSILRFGSLLLNVQRVKCLSARLFTWYLMSDNTNRISIYLVTSTTDNTVLCLGTIQGRFRWNCCPHLQKRHTDCRCSTIAGVFHCSQHRYHLTPNQIESKFGFLENIIRIDTRHRTEFLLIPKTRTLNTFLNTQKNKSWPWKYIWDGIRSVITGPYLWLTLLHSLGLYNRQFNLHRQIYGCIKTHDKCNAKSRNTHLHAFIKHVSSKIGALLRLLGAATHSSVNYRVMKNATV
jgi:hypothetical protein